MDGDGRAGSGTRGQLALAAPDAGHQPPAGKVDRLQWMEARASQPALDLVVGEAEMDVGMLAFELDEIVLHVQKINGTNEAEVSRDLHIRCVEHLEINPNRILFHTAEQMQQLQGVGTLLKEQKLVDHRPLAKAGKATVTATSQ